MKIFVFCSFLFTFGWAPSASAQFFVPGTPGFLAVIVVEDVNGDFAAYGSGFIIKFGELYGVVTAEHVANPKWAIADVTAITVFLIDRVVRFPLSEIKPITFHGIDVAIIPLPLSRHEVDNGGKLASLNISSKKVLMREKAILYGIENTAET